MTKDRLYWIAKFEAFLKKNNCYEEFEQKTIETGCSLMETLSECFNYDCVNDFVSYSFSWDARRFDFWCEIDDKWREICDKEQ